LGDLHANGLLIIQARRQQGLAPLRAIAAPIHGPAGMQNPRLHASETYQKSDQAAPAQCSHISHRSHGNKASIKTYRSEAGRSPRRLNGLRQSFTYTLTSRYDQVDSRGDGSQPKVSRNMKCKLIDSQGMYLVLLSIRFWVSTC